jgi:HD-like signal output (HDOD) protein
MSFIYPYTIEEVCRQASALPCAPRLLPRLIEAMRDPDAAADKIGSIILLDSGLAASTLRVANSAAYGREIPIADVTQAIVVLGGREIYRIAAAAMLARWEEMHQDLLPWSPGAFSRHSFTVAVAAETVGKHVAFGDETNAYSAGLVGDVGRLSLAFLCAPAYPEIGGLVRKGGCRWEEAETKVLGYNNRDIGARLMKAWSFPPIFVTTVEHMDNPEGADEADRPFLAQMHAARYLANSLDPQGTPDEFLFEPQPEFLAGHGYTEQVLEQSLAEVREKTQGHFGHAVGA